MKTKFSITKALKAASSKAFACMLLVSLGSSEARSQSCSLVSQIPISTGYNGTYSSFVGASAADGNWTDSMATPALQAGLSVPASGSLYRITPDPAWATPSGAQWISCSTVNNFPTTANSNVNNLSMVIKREFRTCADDNITIDFTVFADNYMNALWIDGALQTFAQSSTGLVSNFNAGSSYSGTFFMPAGTHTIEMRVANQPVNHPNNAFGICVVGTATGTTTSIVDVTSPLSCSCTPPCGVLQRFNMCTDPILAPFNYTFDIDIAPVSTNFSLDFGDGSPLFMGLSNTTVPHTYSGPLPSGALTLNILDMQGKICDTRRVELCISRSGARQSQGNQTQVTPAKGTGLSEKPFPNPANTSISIPLKGAKGQVSVTILSQDGKMLKTRKGIPKEAEVWEFDTRDLVPGIYYINIADAAGTRGHTFVKN